MYIISLLYSYGNSISREGLLCVVAFVCALLITVMLHEIAHGLSALMYGDTTAKDYGRLTLNPAKHFDPMGILMMLLVGFGWAKPVPVNVNNFENNRSGMIVVSLAGVVTNLFLSFVFMALYVLCTTITYSTDAGYYTLVFFINFAYLMMWLNICFALFNILPLFPLDGYRLLSCFVRQNNSYMTFVRRYSMYIFLALILWQYIPIIGDYSPLTLWIGNVGGYIKDAFYIFWRWVIV